MAMPPPSDSYLVSKDEIVEAVAENRLSWLTTEPTGWDGTTETARSCVENADCNAELNPNADNPTGLVDDGSMADWGEIKGAFQGPDADPDTPQLTDISECLPPSGPWDARVEIDHDGAGFNDPDVDNVQTWRAPDSGGSSGTYSKISTDTPASFPIEDGGVSDGNTYWYKFRFERHVDDGGSPVVGDFGPEASIAVQAADPGCGPE